MIVAVTIADIVPLEGKKCIFKAALYTVPLTALKIPGFTFANTHR